jgi:hypothetical protein
MRDFILALNAMLLVIFAIWAFQTNFEWEPVAGFLGGLSALLYQIWERSKHKDVSDINTKSEPIVNTISNNASNVVHVNVGTSEKETVQNNVINPFPAEMSSNERDAAIELMKQKLNILFIDDDTKFNIVKVLRDSGWKKTRTIADIKSLDMTTVKDSDMYFVDINGVGKFLELPNEGLDLALMLKEKYPNKKVVIYSASPTGRVFHKAWDMCDRIDKNALPSQFTNTVENYSLDLYKLEK